MYAVLKPIYRIVGDNLWAIDWHKVGTASSMQDAKDKFGGRPVLSKEPHWIK